MMMTYSNYQQYVVNHNIRASTLIFGFLQDLDDLMQIEAYLAKASGRFEVVIVPSASDAGRLGGPYRFHE